MAITSAPALFISILLSLVLIPSAQSCSEYTFPGNQAFNSCIDLPFLQANIHWNYIPSTRTVHIAYRANQTSTGWIAWGINPLVQACLTAYPTPITSYTTSMRPGALSFQVSNISATYTNNQMSIFAVLGPLQNATAVNHVWQAGNSVINDIPSSHATTGSNIQSMGTLNFLSG
ncbi:cytochrome b561 and DOMON domain-containing protein [Salix suchowensis]|nr:cytochrome b561 and DOMON domain-containing protein [Salix suchowensis]